MRLVDLADDFHLTTAEAIDLCLVAGIAATSSEDVLTNDEVARWRLLAEEQRAWQAAARDEAAQSQERELAAADARLASARGSFGPLPPAPWEQDRASNDPPVAGAPAAGPAPAELSEGWAPSSTGTGGPQVSLYAAAALALAIVSLIFPFVPVLLAVPLAFYAKSQISKSRGALTGERFASAAIAVSVLGMVLWVGIFAVTLYKDNQARIARITPPDLQVNSGIVAWNELAAGRCIRIPRANLPAEQWQAVDCTAPHEAEVFHTELILRGSADAYPGSGQIAPGAQQTCEARFQDYVGRSFRASELRMGAIFPTSRNWNEENDRTIACVIYQENYNLINGSLKGANR